MVGLFAFTAQALVQTRTTLSNTIDQLHKTEKAFNSYQSMVVQNNMATQALLDELKTIKRGVNVAIKKVEDYPATPVLDAPWPDDFIRMHSAGSNMSSTKDSTSMRKPK